MRRFEAGDRVRVDIPDANDSAGSTDRPALSERLPKTMPDRSRTIPVMPACVGLR